MYCVYLIYSVVITLITNVLDGWDNNARAMLMIVIVYIHGTDGIVRACQNIIEKQLDERDNIWKKDSVVQLYLDV